MYAFQQKRNKCISSYAYNFPNMFSSKIVLYKIWKALVRILSMILDILTNIELHLVG